MHSSKQLSFFLLPLILGLFLPVSLFAQSQKGRSILAIKSYELPSYEEALQTTDVDLYSDKEDYYDSINDSDYEFKKIDYSSDGLKVVCYLYRPSTLESKNYPAIIFNRGSYIRGNIAPELVTMFHRLAEQGFVILAPMYRGSDGGEGKDEMGGDDLHDLMNIPKVAKELGYIDMNNLFLYGESRGGMMVLQSLREKFPANAAATFGAFTNLENLINSDPERYKPMTQQIWPDFKNNSKAILKRRSATQWADAIDIPIMILHGANDQSVNPKQSLDFAKRLQELEKQYELVIYANDNHILANHAKARDQRVVQWFQKHMK